MKLYIEQKIFSFNDKYDVFDSEGNIVFKVDSEMFSFLPKIHLYDMEGNELFFIERNFKLFLSEYVIYKGDNLCATVKQQLRFMSSSFSVESAHGLFEVEGDVFSHDFTIKLDNQLFGEVIKKWMSFGDSYELNVTEEEDASFFCALVIAIDNCLHNNKGGTNITFNNN